jgi:hypothetical protein
LGFSPLIVLCYGCYMGLKQIIQNFSFETLANLPPSELLALALISIVVVGLVLGVLGFIASMLGQ